MKRVLHLLIFIMVFFALVTCDEEFISRDFPSVITLSVDNGSPDRVVFTGELISRKSGVADEVGFIWQKGSDPKLNPGFKANLTGQVTDGPFSLQIYNSLKKDSEYKLRAYAKVKDFLIYGELISFTCSSDYSNPSLSFKPLTGQVGDTIIIAGGYFNADINKNRVTIGDYTADLVKVSDTALYCIVPFQLTTKENTVSFSADGLVSVLPGKFQLGTPTISSFSPATVEFLDTISISGTGFHRMKEFNKVTIGINPATVISSTETSLSVKVPFSNDSLCFVSVSVSGQVATSLSKLKILAPNFDYFIPVLGHYLDTITIFCKNINPLNIKSVSFGSITARITGTGIDKIFVEVPGNITTESSPVKVDFGMAYHVFEVPFHLKQPIVTGISKTDLLNFQNLTIFGSGFSPSNGINNLYLKNTSSNITYIIIPFQSSGDSIKIVIRNPQVPGSELPSGTYQIGIKTCENVLWSDKYIDVTQVNIWRRLGDFPGGERYKGAAFSINGKGYSGLGTKISNDIQKDLWEFNPATETWTRKTDFPGDPRILPAVFQNSSSGFVGGGQSMDNAASQVPLTDFYKYTQATNSWIRVNDIPAVEKSYLGASSSPENDVHTANTVKGIVYEYNSAANIWSETYSGGAFYVRHPLSFSIKGKTYFVCGTTGGPPYKTIGEVWEYDPGSNSMTRKNDFPGVSRYAGFSFSIGNYGYIGCGINYTTDGTTTYLSDVFRYDPDSDSWEIMTSYPGGIRSTPISFVIGKKAYVLTGFNKSSLTSDVWEFSDPENR